MRSARCGNRDRAGRPSWTFKSMLRGRVAKALGQQHPIRPPSRKHNLDKAAIGFSLMRLMLQSVVKASGVRRWGGEAADGQN